MIEELEVDSIVKNVLIKIISRAQDGKVKYGTDLDRNDLKLIEWINHAQEESMDYILYLEKIKNVLHKENIVI